MKADPQAQRRLLDLQAIDTALAQLAHKRKTLPEYAEIDRLARELSSLEDERVRVQVGVEDLDRDIARLEKDVDQVRARSAKDQGRLDEGTGPARQLEALQHEMATLARRQGELEDAELELMEQRESAQGALNDVEQRLVTIRDKRAERERSRDQTLSEIDRTEEFRRSGRAPLVADLPADLVQLYERSREQSGIGAALLRGGRCGACRLDLSGSERARVRATPADEVVRCDECGSIMVRTEESGL
jgi:predicted  nucleic acid-binding Zn-ribbon protein